MSCKSEKVIVSSVIDSKTVKVSSSLIHSHALYGKKIRSSRVFLADSGSFGLSLSIGQAVVVSSSRPISKNKKWLVTKVL